MLTVDPAIVLEYNFLHRIRDVYQVTFENLSYLISLSQTLLKMRINNICFKSSTFPEFILFFPICHTLHPNWKLCSDCFPCLSSVQFSCSVMSDSLWPHGLQHARLPCLSPTPGIYSSSYPSIKSVMPSNHLILSCLLLLPSIFPSIRVFSNESVLHIRWPKYWSFSFSISPSNEYSGLIFFRMYWLDFLAVQGTFKSLFQHHSSKASILQHSDVLIVQLEWRASERRYPMSKVSSSGHEVISHVQGKRNSSKMVDTERGHQRADRVKPQSQKSNQSDHMDQALSNSMN